MKISAKGTQWLAILVIGLSLLIAPAVILSIMRVDTSSSDVQPWFPDSTPERERLLEFESIFGPQDFWLIALEDSEGRFDLKELVQKIGSIDDSNPGPKLIASVRAGSEFLKGKSEAERAELKASLAGVFFSHDGEREAAFLRSSDVGFLDRIAVHEIIVKAVEELGIPPEVIHYTGPGYLGVMADRETRETLELVTPVTFILSALFAWILLNNLKTAGIALFASGIAAGIPVVAIYLSGKSMSHLLVVVPSLAQLLALSNAVHLIQYYKDAVKKDPGDGVSPAVAALRHGLRPTVAACLTTAIGFLALQSSSLPVVRSFSLFGTFSVLGAMVAVLTIVPASLFLLRPEVVERDLIERSLMPGLDRFVKRFSLPLSLVLISVLIGSFWGVARLKTEVRMETFFSEKSDFTRHYSWFNDQFGENQTTQVFGGFDEKMAPLEQLKAVASFVDELESDESGLKTFSMVSLLPADIQILDYAPPELIDELLDNAREQNFLGEHGGNHFWKVTVFDEPYPDISSSLTVQKVEAAIERHRAAEGALPVPWRMTGSYQLFGSAQETLLQELLMTFLLAFVLITPCIILFLRNLKLGLIAMIGNMFPIAVFFGAMGFLGFRIDIATMVIASIAFGIAIDDTVHFLARLCERKPGEDAISLAFQKAGAAIFKTTVIISIGMLAFLLSDFDPSRRFAICTSIVLSLAVIGDLVLLPALIRGPLSRLFSVQDS